LTGCQGEKIRKQGEYQPGHLAKQALIGFEVWAEYLGNRKHKLPMRQIKEQVVG